MSNFTRSQMNPFLTPDKNEAWEAEAAFNPCVVKAQSHFHLLYRAISSPQNRHGIEMPVSSIGYAVGNDGTHFHDRRQLIKPEWDWEKFGCEDPRVTLLDGKFYIFYTALSTFPFSPQGIRIGLAITTDFKKIDAKFQITTFNSKAMAMFPEKINGKIAVILTVHTDIPPAKIAIAYFDREDEIHAPHYWDNWYASLDAHVIPLLRRPHDHLEVGAPPIKTNKGWLLIYSYIRNYFSAEKIFGIEAVLLDLNDPKKVIGRTSQPLLKPEKNYELNGDVPNVIFPSSALIEKGQLYIYYGAADTTCCLAVGSAEDLLKELTQKPDDTFVVSTITPNGFKRYQHNPILFPRPEFSWEAKEVFNPGVLFDAGIFHIIYRATSLGGNSVFGYAMSNDGIHITERLGRPVYLPRETYEEKMFPGAASGCEDPRLTKIADRIYMFYTAYDGHYPRVAFTSIKIEDFLDRKWYWERSQVISPPMIACKNACLLPEKINGKFIVFFRTENSLYLNALDNLSFTEKRWLEAGEPLVDPRNHKIKVFKVGICGPPIETKYGWIMFYHWVRDPDSVYQISACLLELNNPAHVITQSCEVLLQPETHYEKVHASNVVFSCGAVLKNNEIFFYYGAGDKVIGLAKIGLDEILKVLGVHET